MLVLKEITWVKTKYQTPEGMNRSPLIPLKNREYRGLMLKCQYQVIFRKVKEIGNE
jgi:hypothetical protein